MIVKVQTVLLTNSKWFFRMWLKKCTRIPLWWIWQRGKLLLFAAPLTVNLLRLLACGKGEGSSGGLEDWIMAVNGFWFGTEEASSVVTDRNDIRMDPRLGVKANKEGNLRTTLYIKAACLIFWKIYFIGVSELPRNEKKSVSLFLSPLFRECVLKPAVLGISP